MRVCHLAKYYAPFCGGIETHVRSLAIAQGGRYENVTVACVNHLDRHGNDVWCDRTAWTPTVNKIERQVEVRAFGKLGTLARFDFCFGIHSFLKRAADHFDLLHLHVPNPAMCVWLAASKPKLPVVVTYHSDIIKQRIIRKPFRLIENLVFPHVTRFIASSEAYQDSSLVLSRFRNKTSVIPFGLDELKFELPSEEAREFANELRSVERNQPLWLCVGRLVYYKGFEVAIRALEKCRGRLMIVGSGPLKAQLVGIARRLGVENRIIWLAALTEDQLIGAYHAATALWFPSVVRSEAFGLVQLEAMACSCPVINTNIPGSGVSWVSPHGISGLTVDVGDSDALADAANRIDSDPALRNKLAVGAESRFHEVFSLKMMVESTDHVYQSACGCDKLLTDSPESVLAHAG